MDADVLFAAAAVTDFGVARAWYERFFGRPPDVVAHDEEVMWQVTMGGWLYVLRDTERAGSSMVTVAVADIESATAELVARGLVTGPIEPEGEAGLKALVRDPEGNSIVIIQVA